MIAPAHDRLLTTAEAAAFLGVSPKTCANWRSAAIGPAYVQLRAVGLKRAAIRYRLDDLNAWADAGRVEPGAA